MNEAGHSWRYRATVIWGWLNILAGPLVWYLLQIGVPDVDVDARAFAVATQVLAGAALIYAGRLKIAGADIGHKAFPAAWVAYGFVVLMTVRLVSDAGMG